MYSKNTSSQHIVIRPKKWNILVNILAIMIFLFHAFMAFFLRRYDIGVYLDSMQPLALVFIGILWAVTIEIFLRFKITITPKGVIIKNFVPISKRIIWKEIKNITFPDSSNWARIELAQDEYIPVLALQRLDGDYSLTQLKRIISLYKKYG